MERKVMITDRLKLTVPYAVILVGGLALYAVANRIQYTPIPDQIGPEVWPKLILGLMIAVCVIEIARRVFFFSAASNSEATITPASPELEYVEDHVGDPLIVGCVIVASVIYLLALEIGGFFLCTLVYTASLLALGGIRRLTLIAAVSAAITVFFTFTFMKVIFVSLPIGVEPFAHVSIAVMSLLGIH